MFTEVYLFLLATQVPSSYIGLDQHLYVACFRKIPVCLPSRALWDTVEGSLTVGNERKKLYQ